MLLLVDVKDFVVLDGILAESMNFNKAQAPAIILVQFLMRNQNHWEWRVAPRNLHVIGIRRAIFAAAGVAARIRSRLPPAGMPTR